MAEPAISVRDVSKCYRVFDDQRSRLLHAMWPAYGGGRQDIWALKNVSFDVARGDSFAIIGRNGSGKSTLLEIITGTLAPSGGQVDVRGRVAALLELGSGFNPEYTGRENVYLNGLLLGIGREQIHERFDDIASFADIGDVLDRPVKTYSSGMLVRLAFAVQVALEPEILIVDEALSVGDYFFQQKCFGRLRKMREDGLTLLFVSHDMGSVRDLCSRAIYLAGGSVMFMGDSKLAIGKYLNQTVHGAERVTAPSAQEGDGMATAAEVADLPIEHAMWRGPPGEIKDSRILAVLVKNGDGEFISSQLMGEKIYLTVVLQIGLGDSGHVTLSIKNRYDQIVNSSSTWSLNIPPLQSNNGRTIGFEFEIDCMMEAGQYSLLVTLSTPTRENSGTSKDATGWFGPFEIRWDYERSRAPFLGMFGLPIDGKPVEIKV